MTRLLGPSFLASILPALALGGCVAPPTSLGDPPETETSSISESTGDPGSSGQTLTDGDASTSGGDIVTTTSAGTSTDDGSSTHGDDVVTTTSAGTSTDDGNTTGDPLDAAMVIFVNFDGIVLIGAETDDATMDQSMLADDTGMPWGSYGVGPKRDEIMIALAGYFAPFDVGVTSTRPESGDYTMIVVTPTNPFGGGVVGISPLDCNNANPNNVGFVFGSIADPFPAEVVAASIAHVVADSLGLEHTDSGDLTDPSAIESYVFTDACAPLFIPTQCEAQHAVFCPPGQQNSFAELSAWFPL
jgi:hypothetical protein